MPKKLEPCVLRENKMARAIQNLASVTEGDWKVNAMIKDTEDAKENAN